MKRVFSVIKKESSSVIAFCILAAILICLLLLDVEKDVFSSAFHHICVATREFVGFSTIFCLLLLLFLVCSKYGKIKLGGKDAKPEYSNLSWFSCLLMSGMGIGLIFYCQEPLYHFYNNPYVGHVSGDPKQIAYSLTLYDWSFNVWGIYGLLGLIIAYFYYNKHRDLKLSSALPARTNLWIKKLIDILMALGIVAGLTTSLGMGVMQLKGGIDFVFNVDSNPYFLMLIVGLIATWSVRSGLKRGVKWLSNIAITLVFILLAVVVILAYIKLGVSDFVGYTFSGLVNFVQNYVFYNDYWNSASDSWAASWAIFYQLWYAAWAAFVAVFVAKISKGRTIKEFIFAVVVLPSAFSAIWFGIFGNVGFPIREELYSLMQENVPQSVFFLFSKLSDSWGYIALSILVLLTICLFFITSSDSSSYVVATILSDDKNVRSFNKIFWSLIQTFAAMILFYCGGLSLIQSASVVLGLVVLLIIILGGIYFIYILRKDEKQFEFRG